MEFFLRMCTDSQLLKDIEHFDNEDLRVLRIWREEELLRVPKRKRVRLYDGSCIRLRALYPNHV